MIQKLISILIYLLCRYYHAQYQSNLKTNKGKQKRAPSYIANPNRITSNSITEEKNI